jgi:hypothetical protein
VLTDQDMHWTQRGIQTRLELGQPYARKELHLLHLPRKGLRMRREDINSSRLMRSTVATGALLFVSRSSNKGECRYVCLESLPHMKAGDSERKWWDLPKDNIRYSRLIAPITIAINHISDSGLIT